MKKSTQLNWVNYYRNSLADGEMLDIKAADCKEGAFFDDLSELTHVKLKEFYNKFWNQIRKPNNEATEEDKLPIDIFISPFYIDSEYVHGKQKSNYKRVYPYWIPVTLTPSGILQISAEDNKCPWFMRSVLEPVYSETGYYPVLSSVDNIDQVLNSFNYCFDSWEDYWNSAENFFEMVTGARYSEFALEGYNTVCKICVIKAKSVVTAKNILNVYDDVLRDKMVPSLMGEMLSISKEREREPIPENKKLFLSKGHYGQYGNQFPLSTSQRVSLMLFEQDKSGQVLAVNGPPGTGKTTILQSIVANEMVKAAIRGNEPPKIVASSTNNQAITNILDSFKSGGDIERWIPNVNSLGAYLIANNPGKQEEALKKGYQLLYRSDNLIDGFYFNDVCSIDFQEIEQHFLDRFTKTHPDLKDATIETAIEFLSQRIKNLANEIDYIIKVVSSYIEAEDKYFPLSNLPSFKEEIEQLEGELNLQVAYRKKLIRFREQYADFIKKNRFSLFFSFISSVRESFQRKFFLFLTDSPAPELKRQTSKKGVESTLINLFIENEKEVVRLEDEANTKNSLYRELLELWKDFKSVDQQVKELRQTYLSTKNEKEREALEKDYNQLHYSEQVNQTLDVSKRYQIFIDTIHFWEGLWIIQQRGEILEQNRGYAARLQVFSQISYLTPLFISTFHSLPGYCAFSEKTPDSWIQKPLYDLFDLLIVDEAGQVSPEVGVASFALAKRAIVVGDVHQIEPVWNIPMEKIDMGNLFENELLSEFSFQELKNIGVLCSSGSLMHLARNASNYEVNSKMGGTILTEHRRCVDELVEFCNEFVYEGLLIPKVGKLKIEDIQIPLDGAIFNLPPLSYVNVRGYSAKRNGSLYNEFEAQAIAKWIAKYGQAIVNHFGKGKKKHIKDCIAVITPFAEQKNEVYKSFKEHGVDTQITVGTVHSLQGAERPLIIFSPTYGVGHNGQMFFDSGYNMLNVAITRAKKHFVVMGNMALFNPKRKNVPSGGLAKYLFANEQNELSSSFLFEDLAVNIQSRIDSLEKHQKCIERVFVVAKERVVIVSPFISINAINSDNITDKIRECIERNVKVTIYTDEFLDKPKGVLKKTSAEGRQALVDIGVELVVLNGIHNKALLKDEDLLIEGSFNWLSASRDTSSPNFRFDVSHIIQEPEAVKHIKQLLDELDKIGLQ